MIIVLAIGMFCASIYMLLSGLTVKQREIATHASQGQALRHSRPA